jgi:hypothetical protein
MFIDSDSPYIVLWVYSYIDLNFTQCYNSNMKKLTRVPYNTTVNALLLKKLKILAVEQDKRHNDILEEAIVEILKKYGKRVSKKLTYN